MASAATEVERGHCFVDAQAQYLAFVWLDGDVCAEPFLGVVGTPGAGSYYYGVAGEFTVFEGYACYAVAFGLQGYCFALPYLRAVALCGACEG